MKRRAVRPIQRSCSHSIVMLSECGPLLPARVEAPLPSGRLSSRGPSTRAPKLALSEIEGAGALAQDDNTGRNNFCRTALVLGLFLLFSLAALAQSGGERKFYLHSDPKTFDPLAVADDASETIRYLTGGVLLRVNRRTQQAEPELATAWTIARDGRSITFNLREHIYYSDG